MKYRRIIQHPIRALQKLQAARRGRATHMALPKFKKKANPFMYSFDATNGWEYFDGAKMDGMHLVLKDHTRRPRFVLWYDLHRPQLFKKHGVLMINAIQRERNSPTRSPFAGTDMAKETRESKELQKYLGMHPTEFLLSEFIYQNREAIRNGTRVVLTNDGKPMLYWTEIYKPIIDRFFVRTSDPLIRSLTSEKSEVYVLSPQKRRVKELLAE